ncbi:hypothetical protein BDW62DRAFT_197891 [Aspergillus aurantiobrunneus]
MPAKRLEPSPHIYAKAYDRLTSLRNRMRQKVDTADDEEFNEIEIVPLRRSPSERNGRSIRPKSGPAETTAAFFGIGADSYEFHFVVIDNNGDYSWHTLNWISEENKVAIVSQLARIMREAASLVPTSKRKNLETVRA